ncbi:DNA-binding transcriptional LysR family regulator [Paenarthrobacter nicotinovorans]|uniref:LysR substrate-binding domain-containing protein n=1 Tax=Paenarthrobacter nicotinovorans TaxID=29320 RepID=UPI0027836B0F|nr:LysR substrate-binding domain-containing protein [Paenarthrobacter nicotinovorans]MDP9936789.1 DNA-binding transcriptional LysR family regulator [Paenarthrobacter nicotinovorans]
MIEVRQARYFIAVAEELHFGRAAERLAMSQPPLSQAILQLERQIGTGLLTRSSRTVSLTEAGRLFLDECRRLVQASRRAEEVASQARSGMAGSLRVGSVTSAFNRVLPEVLRLFMAQWPEVDLEVSEIDTHVGRDRLVRRELDVAIIRQAVSGKDLRSVPLRRDRFVLALPRTHVMAQAKGPVDLARFRDESWVWLPRAISPDYHDEMVAACRHAGFSPNAKHFANSIQSQLAMVGCGLGVTLAPNSSTTAGAGYLLRELVHGVDLVELSLVTRAGSNEAIVENFVRCAQSIILGSAAND